MKLTKENKAEIDKKSYEELLRGWRHAPPGDKWFDGETGKYWAERMQTLIEQGADTVTASKNVGWAERVTAK